MSFEDFLWSALKPDERLRCGQTLMRQLHDVRFDLYMRIISDPPGIPCSGAQHDCYYDDSKVWSTAQWLKENW